VKADKPNPKDPRYRPFRIAMYAVYLTAVGIISLLIVISVVRSVAAMTPSRPPPAKQVLSVQECLDRADDLWNQLETRRRKLTDEKSARHADEAWGEFRVQWLEKKRDAESRCDLDSRDRQALSKAYGRLERVMDLYTIHATQYAGEIGLVVDELRASIHDAEEDLHGKKK
jgi:hypothetical protein